MAGAVVGRVSVDLILKSASFKREMSKVAKKVRRFNRSADLMKKVLAGIGIGLAARAFVRFARAQAQAVDSMAKFADQIGITTENLAGLRHAAELTGVGARTLDMGLQRMTRRIAEAAQGTGEAREAIKELGLDAKALAAAGPGVAFSRIAEAMKGVQTQSDKVRLAFKLFDSEGVALVNTLNLGSKGLAKMQRSAEELGLAISRTDAAEIEKMNDAMTELNAAWEGFARTTLVVIAPAMKSILETIRDATLHVKSLFVAEKERAAPTPAAEFMRKIGRQREAADAAARRRAQASTGAAFGLRDPAAEAAQALELQRTLAFNKTVFEAQFRRFRVMAEREASAGVAGQEAPSALPGPATVAPAVQKRFETIQKGLLSEREALQAHFAIQKQTVMDWWGEDQSRAMEAFAAKTALEDQLQMKITEIDQRESEKRLAIAKAEADQRLRIRMGFVTNILGTIQNLASIDAQASRESFERHKRASIAMAVGNTAVAATMAWRSLPPWAAPAGAAFAIAAGAAQIASIRSTSFGGGGGAVATPAGAAAVGADGGGGGNVPDVFVSIQGDSSGGEPIRDLMDRLNQEFKDGYRIFVDEG